METPQAGANFLFDSADDGLLEGLIKQTYEVLGMKAIPDLRPENKEKGAISLPCRTLRRLAFRFPQSRLTLAAHHHDPSFRVRQTPFS